MNVNLISLCLFIFVNLQAFGDACNVAIPVGWCTPMPCVYRYSLPAQVDFSTFTTIPIRLNNAVMSQSCLPEFVIGTLPVTSSGDIAVIGNFQPGKSIVDFPSIANFRLSELSQNAANAHTFHYQKWFETSPPNCVYVDNLGVSTEFLDGATLTTYVNDKPLPPDNCAMAPILATSKCGGSVAQSGQWDVAPQSYPSCRFGCVGPDLRKFRSGDTPIYFSATDAYDCNTVKTPRLCTNGNLDPGGDYGSCLPRVDCVVNWSACSGGLQSYTISVPPANNGVACPVQNPRACGTPALCGLAQGGTFPTAPVANLCSSGNSSAVVDGANWSWTCDSADGGAQASCSALKTVVVAGAVQCSGSFTETCRLGGGCNVPAWNQFKDWVAAQMTSLGSADPYLDYSTQFADMGTLYRDTVFSGRNFGGRSQTQSFALGPYTVSFTSSWIGNETLLPGSFDLTNDGSIVKTSNGACPTGPVGICGTSNNATLNDAPNSNLCSVGNPSIVSWNSTYNTTNHWAWTCGSGADAVNCQAQSSNHWSYCFVEGTQVTMASGKTKSIESIEVGEQIRTYDEIQKQIIVRPVSEVFHHESKVSKLFTFYYGNQKVTSNGIHRYFLADTQEYKSAEEIYKLWKVGKPIVFLNEFGQRTLVDNIDYETKDVPLFNLHVNGLYDNPLSPNSSKLSDHNYFANGVLVHNVKDCGGASVTTDIKDITRPCIVAGTSNCNINLDLMSCYFNSLATTSTFMTCMGNAYAGLTTTCSDPVNGPRWVFDKHIGYWWDQLGGDQDTGPYRNNPGICNSGLDANPTGIYTCPAGACVVGSTIKAYVGATCGGEFPALIRDVFSAVYQCKCQ